MSKVVTKHIHASTEVESRLRTSSQGRTYSKVNAQISSFCTGALLARVPRILDHSERHSAFTQQGSGLTRGLRCASATCLLYDPGAYGT